jgi:hypothetical protein
LAHLQVIPVEEYFSDPEILKAYQQSLIEEKQKMEEVLNSYKK